VSHSLTLTPLPPVPRAGGSEETSEQLQARAVCACEPSTSAVTPLLQTITTSATSSSPFSSRHSLQGGQINNDESSTIEIAIRD
jgi:hypothetical protein